MMDFVLNNYDNILAVIIALAIATKVNSIRYFFRLGWESPNPGPRIETLRKITIFEVLFTTELGVFIVLHLNSLWAGVVGAPIIALLVNLLGFSILILPTVVGNIIYRFSGKEKQDREKFEGLSGNCKNMEEWEDSFVAKGIDVDEVRRG